MKGQLLKVTNVLYPPRPKFPRFTSYFQKNSGDCGDKIENRYLFRKQNKRALRFFLDTVVVVAAHVWLLTLTKARPAHKHSQHSHSFSHYRCMDHG